jgi:phosphoserine phosphatase
MQSPVFICDLDLTLLRVNSFPLWALHLMAGRVPGLGVRSRARLSLRVQGLLLRRKLGRIDHAGLLRGLQRAWHDASPGTPGRLEERLLRHVRPGVTPFLRRIAAGEVDAVLATAAAGEYALGLGRRLGFRHVLATPCRCGPADRPNEGEEKLRRVRLLLETLGWASRPRVVLTDHRDDLPLMRHAHAVGWYGAADDGPGLDFIACHELDGAATLHAVDALVQRAQAAAGIRRASAVA